MKRVARLFALLTLALVVTGNAWAAVENHDETSEGAVQWAVGAPSPGTGPPGPTVQVSHLLISEVVVTPTAAEFFEIHNPDKEPVDLSDYYVTDAWFESPLGTPINGYYELPQVASGTYSEGVNSDFIVKFPPGASIQPGQTIVIALYGRGADSTYGVGTADYSITNVPGSTIPVMVSQVDPTDAPTANATTLTNTSETIVIFRWDGVSDLVCDVDYVSWGPNATGSRVDKTGLSVDSFFDADAVASTFAADVDQLVQTSVTAPLAGESIARTTTVEGNETLNGNGCSLPTDLLPAPGLTPVAAGIASILLAAGGWFAVRRRYAV